MSDTPTIEKLTLAIAKSEIAEIERIAFEQLDNAKAHEKEANLYRWFVACIVAEMYHSAFEIISIGLLINSTKELEFERWYE